MEGVIYAVMDTQLLGNILYTHRFTFTLDS